MSSFKWATFPILHSLPVPDLLLPPPHDVLFFRFNCKSLLLVSQTHRLLRLAGVPCVQFWIYAPTKFNNVTFATIAEDPETNQTTKEYDKHDFYDHCKCPSRGCGATAVRTPVLRSRGRDSVSYTGKAGEHREATTLASSKVYGSRHIGDHGICRLRLHWKILQECNQARPGVCYGESDWE